MLANWGAVWLLPGPVLTEGKAGCEAGEQLTGHILAEEETGCEGEGQLAGLRLAAGGEESRLRGNTSSTSCLGNRMRASTWQRR